MGKIYKSMALDETFSSSLGGINNNLINILHTNYIENCEPNVMCRSLYYDSDKFSELTQTIKSCLLSYARTFNHYILNLFNWRLL